MEKTGYPKRRCEKIFYITGYVGIKIIIKIKTVKEKINS